MKKMLKWLGLFLIFACVMTVQAENYKVKELIPKNIKTTINTQNFRYKQLYYDGENQIAFSAIKNISEEEAPISISIALFDSHKKNIGTINYCSSEEVLLPAEEMKYSIEITKDYLGSEKELADIHYIAILGDNISCRSDGSDEFLGQKIEQIGKIEFSKITPDVMIFIKMMIGVVVLLVAILLYKYMFTTAYVNMDGEEVREDYKDWNKKQAKKRKDQEKEKVVDLGPTKANSKSERILEQEEKAKEEDKTGTDLHNLYK